VEQRDAGAVHGEDRGDGQPAVGSDLVAVGFGDLLDEPVGAQDPELPAHGRRTPPLLFQGQEPKRIGRPVSPSLEVPVSESVERELPTIDRQ